MVLNFDSPELPYAIDWRAMVTAAYLAATSSDSKVEGGAAVYIQVAPRARVLEGGSLRLDFEAS